MSTGRELSAVSYDSQRIPGFGGVVLTPSVDGYETARQIFNERLVGRPALIAQCTGAADVQAALRYAQAENLAVSVRSGGHGLAGWASNDDGLVVDLTRLRWVRVDPDARSAWVGGGVRALDVVTKTLAHGLAPVTGVSPLIGLAGLATGAGEGFLTPQHGYASDNVRAFELVTANGSLLRVSATEHADLFWAMRGAGPNFGVVTAMQVDLHPVPPVVVGGWLTFDGVDALRVTECVWDLLERGSPRFFPQITYGVDPGGAMHVRVMPGFLGPEESAIDEITQLRQCAPPLDDDVSAMSYLELLHQIPGEFGRRHSWDIYHLPFDVDRTAQIEMVLAQATRLRPMGGFFDLWRTMPGSVSAPASALPRRPGVSLVAASIWENASDDDLEIARISEIATAFRDSGLVGESPSASNHVSSHEPPRVIAKYGADGYARLQRLKAVYDPHNVFRRNYNVPPAP
ncbi:FAD-binding oxidoreductase [Enemella evansiae]|uniref:FAD-binding oxidoreductase n=1 Tax=Enemella evansiae TaxID=2016499 RepID=UPI00105E82A8|nr:FAD-binding oxidoreductase [Enemella evansiae]TDO92380.1 FAD/FMN-containing dehydrogenase [Enemella evansiae]